MIVAIDGPAGSGKSTTARRVAARLGWLYLDTGAMYRAAGLAFLDAGRSFDDDTAAELVPGLEIDLHPAGDGLRVLLSGEDVTERIRTPLASEAASRVSALAAVRARLVEEQRRIAHRRLDEGVGVVIEGRDIGTVVFPEAELKVFLVADLDERARRRHAELATRGERTPVDDVAAEIRARDDRDASRALAPLKPAPDAVELDTTALTPDEQVERVLALVAERQREPGAAARG